MDDDYQERVAASIYEGVMRYFTEEKELQIKMEKKKN